MKNGACGDGEAALGCVVGRALLGAAGVLGAAAVDAFVLADGSAEEARPMVPLVSGRL